MNKLAGKVAVVTGGAQGQGAAEAALFAQNGAHVVIADVKENEGLALAESIKRDGGSAQFVNLDVTEQAQWDKLEAALREGPGRLDVLVNNAGIAFRYGLMLTTEEDFRRVLSVSLIGPFLGIRTLAKLIRDTGGGSIINVGSAAGMTGHFSAAYGSSKWGLRGLTKVAGMEFASWNIRVNAIHPGIVNTALVPGDTAFPQAMTAHTPLGRAAEPDDIAPVVLFLASDDSRFITGTDIAVDGGLVELGVYNAVTKEYARLSADQLAEQKSQTLAETDVESSGRSTDEGAR